MWFMAAILLGCVATSRAELPCYSTNPAPYLYFGTRTSYEFVHEDSTVVNYPDSCEPRQFWFLARHGTRYPSGFDNQRMTDLGHKIHKMLIHKNIKLCDADIARIRAWKLKDIPYELTYELTRQGFLELYDIAKRFQKRFPKLLAIPFDDNKFLFRYSNMSMTLQSARSFSKGLFGYAVPFPPPHDPDWLLEAYKSCPLWLEVVNESPASHREMMDFIRGPVVKDLVSQVSERLGFNGSALSYNDVSTLYDLCRYEKAWDPQLLSTWCSVFTEDELKVLEYRDDVMLYYDKSYGSDMNTKLGCEPVTDLVERFSDLAGGASHQPLAVLYFSHTTMLNMVLSSLGLFKDSRPLTSKNFLEMRDRQYRSSLIGPFASNMAAVFYQCSEGERDRFQLFVQEKPVSLPGCPEGELCSWAHVKQLLASAVQECDLSFCHLALNHTKL